MNRFDAANALGNIGAPAVDRLIASMKDPDPRVRAGAARALGRMKVPGAAESMIAALKDPDRLVRSEAVEVLCKNNASWVVGPLMVAFRNPDSEFRGRCIAEAGEIEAPIINPLIAVLNGPDSRARSLAAETLVHIVAAE